MADARSRIRDLIGTFWVLGLLGVVYVLEPDTSLEEVRKSGVLRACLPASYPPLVTGEVERPGIDVELLQAIAKDIGVRLSIATSSQMGQDFNPRNWRITRAQCQVLGGGVVESGVTRSFLDTVAGHEETGWAIVSKADPPPLAGRKVAVLAGLSGLDRIALSRDLRAAQASVSVAPTPAVFVQRIASGEVDAGITEKLIGQRMAAENGWRIGWAPGDLPRFRIVFGVWKGDLTLRRAIDSAYRKLERTGEKDRILARYLTVPSAARP
jgi:ABC-type amino acid transport substrate-binding protein